MCSAGRGTDVLRWRNLKLITTTSPGPQARSTTAIATLSAVAKTFGSGEAAVSALQSIDLEIAAGELLVVLGSLPRAYPNGQAGARSETSISPLSYESAQTEICRIQRGRPLVASTNNAELLLNMVQEFPAGPTLDHLDGRGPPTPDGPPISGVISRSLEPRAIEFAGVQTRFGR
jgi:hypothetical protein